MGRKWLVNTKVLNQRWELSGWAAQAPLTDGGIGMARLSRCEGRACGTQCCAAGLSSILLDHLC